MIPMPTDAQHGPDGRFQQQIDPEAVVGELTQADRALATNEVADRLDRPRTSVFDVLADLADEGRVRTEKVHQQTRLWWVPGRWGETSVEDLYPTQPLLDYLDTGRFPAGTDSQSALEMISECLVELNYGTPLDGGYRYDEIRRLAALFDMPVAEFVECSPSDIHTRFHDGGVMNLPGCDDTGEATSDDGELPSGPEYQERREAAGVFQYQVADAVGLDQWEVSMFETGKRDLGDETVRALAGALADLRSGADVE